MWVPRNLHCTRPAGRSLFPRWKNFLNPKTFVIQMIKESLRDHSRTWIEDINKLNADERVWCHLMLLYRCTIVQFLLNFLDLSSTTFEISLFLCPYVRRLTLVAYNSSFKTEEFLHNIAISFSDLRSCIAKSFRPCQRNWLNAQFSLFILTRVYFACSSLPWFH